jgi:SAM-dependent methyltransferase
MPDFNPGKPDPRLTALLAEYPMELFDDALFQSIEWADRYSRGLAFDILERLGVLGSLDRWWSADALCCRGGFDPRFRGALVWLLERLVESGDVIATETEGERRYRCGHEPRRPALEALRQAGLAIHPANRATLDLLDAAAQAYPSVARGESGGEEALFQRGGPGLWLAYFHNDNPLYAVNNRVSAIAAANRLADKPAWRLLEIGAGGGSATEALLSVLAGRGLLNRIERYLVTEPSPFFRRRCARELKRKYPDLPLEIKALDIDQPWEDQGAGAGDFDLVYGVNVLHVARDLLFSLRQARASLALDGWLVAGECVRPFPDHTIYIELVFQLLEGFTRVTTDPGIRPSPGFLCPEHWQRALGAAEFSSCQLSPDHLLTRDIYPRLFIAAVCGR